MRAREVPAVSVGTTGAAPLSALVDVPAADPGGVLGVALVTRAGETPDRVGAVGQLSAVRRSIELKTTLVMILYTINEIQVNERRP